MHHTENKLLILLSIFINDISYCSPQLNCPAAYQRIMEDRPITIKDDKGNTSKCIAEIVSVSICLVFMLLHDFIIVVVL